MFTVLPFIVAMFIAVAGMPTDVVQVCYGEMGHEHTLPWRSKALSFARRTGRLLISRLRGMLTGWRGQPLAMPALGLVMVVAALLWPATLHAHHIAVLGVTAVAAVPASTLKAYRQRDSDLKADIAKFSKERAAIGETAMRESRAMTADEKTKFLALGPQIEGLQAQLEENAELLKAAEAANEADRSFAAGRVTPDADAEAARLAGARAGLQPNLGAESEEDRLMKTPGFIGKCMQAVRRVAIRETQAGDDNLLKILAGPTGMSTDVPSDGGFAIAPNWSNNIIQRTYDVGEILGLVDRMTITQGNGMNLPAIDETSRADNSRYGGIVSGWIGQGNTLSAGKPKLRLMELKLRKAAAFVYQTDELIADAPALQRWIEKFVPLELSFRAEDGIVNGDGSNKPQGIMSSGAAVTVTRNTASRVLYEDVSGMWKRMWAPLRKGAIWMVDQSVEQELEQLSIAIGTAGVLAPIYKPAGIAVGPDGTQGYSPATLYGRPILTTEYGAALGTVGDIVLWAPGEYQVIDRGAIDQQVSLHVAFLTDEAVWRFIYRLDGQLKWNSALTLKSGGSSVSAVVTLT